MKNYFSGMLLACATFFSICGHAQLIATDDAPGPINGISGGFATVGSSYFSILSNDSYNGVPLVAGQVVITMLSTTNPDVAVSGGYVHVNPGTPAGTYLVVYQICKTSDLTICDTANVTVQVCGINAPVIDTPTCASSVSSLLLQGLPTGSWTLFQLFNNTTQSTISGSGPTYLLSGLQPGSYQFNVSDSSGCTSGVTSVSLGYLNGLQASLSGVYNDANANSIIDIGDTVTYTVSITNTLTCAITNLDLDQTWGIATNVPSSLPAGATTIAPTIVYQITQSDINAGTIQLWASVMGMSNGWSVYTKAFGDPVTLAIPDGIRLNAFLDLTPNYTQDFGEPGANVGTYEVSINGGPARHFYTSDGSLVLYESNPANTYDITLSFYAEGCPQFSSTVFSYPNVTVPAGSGLTTYDFPITVSPCVDVSAIIYPSTGTPRPGMTYSTRVYFWNNGNQNMASGTLTFTKPDNVTVMNISPGIATPTATGFTYDFVNLGPLTSRYFDVSMLVPPLPTVALGDQLISTVSITIPPGDIRPLNNSSSITQTVSGSYDPNNKTESHGGQILFSDFSSDDHLTYTIRFENTGSANALRINVTDILDSALDETSIRMIETSHPYVLERTGSTLSWVFDGINLAPLAKGSITFEVRPKPGFAVGDIIPNNANIYFDTNPAIVTSTVNTEFVSVLKTASFENENIFVFPNPVSHILTVRNKLAPIESIALSDVTGKIMVSKNIGEDHTEIDMSSLESGIYILSVKTASGSRTIKIIKK